MAEKENVVVKTVAKEKDIVIVDNVIIKQVSSPSTIASVAKDKGINPQEVFVRVTFEYSGDEFGVSQKLRILTKAGYQELLDAQKNKTPMKLAVDRASEFFYIEKDISVDDLFKEEVKRSDSRKSLASLLV